MKILLDVSNAWYRSYIATMLDKPGGPVMIMTYMLRKLCNEYGKNNVILCWDCGKSGRDQLDENYKSDRKPIAGVWDDLNYMEKMITCLGISSSYLEGFEADDIIGSLAKQSDVPIRIISYDKDFYQLVDEKINVLRPERTIKGNKVPQQIIDRNSVIEEFGCPPEKVVLCKSFKGDASDSIPKISIRFTKNFSEQFYEVILASNNVEEFYKNLASFESKYHQALLEFKERAMLNEQIIKIRTDLNPTFEQESSIDSEIFTNLCNELKITKLKVSDWQNMVSEAPPPAPVQNALF
jgi:DNA polymerase-1